MTHTRVHPQGRRPATDHAVIERAAFRLFAEQGFEATTMDQIADAVGVGRRTLFRYFPSKNDIPWGQFDQSLRQFNDQLEAAPNDLPLPEAVHQCVVAFNDFGDGAAEQHRTRMALILGTPSLQAHSALRYAAWRRVISDYVARRKGMERDALLPRLVGHVSLALALAAYESWLDDPEGSLTEFLDTAMAQLRAYLSVAN